MPTETALQPNKTAQRNIGYDILRIMATFAVMLLHTAGDKWGKVDIQGYDWNILNLYDSIVRWAVPIFVMISGALFLNAENSIEKLYKKYILRIVTALLFWSAIYAVLDYQQDHKLFHLFGNMIYGHYHLWFLYMIVGLYMIIPFLKKIIENKTLTKYFLALALIFSFAIPETIAAMSLFSSKLGEVARHALNNMRFHFVIGFPFYFILGYCFTKIKLTRKWRLCIALGGVIGFASTILLTWFFTRRTGNAVKDFYDNMTVNVALCAVFVFSLAEPINKIRFSDRAKKVILALSKYSFGAYLVHDIFLKQVLDRTFHLNALTLNPLFSVPLTALLAFIGSFAVSAILNHIPILKKYIV